MEDEWGWMNEPRFIGVVCTHLSAVYGAKSMLESICTKRLRTALRNVRKLVCRYTGRCNIPRVCICTLANVRKPVVQMKEYRSILEVAQAGEASYPGEYQLSCPFACESNMFSSSPRLL